MLVPHYVTCLSLVCPVGLSPESAAAAMRGSIDAFAQLVYVDNSGEPIIGAVVPGLSAELRGRDRIVELLSIALEGVDAHLSNQINLEALPLLLCVREPERPGAPMNGVVTEVESRLRVRFSRSRARPVARGPVAVIEALAEARQILGDGSAEACLIVAVDTLIDARALLWLERTKRLKTATQSDGLIPGEAAGVLLITTEPMTPRCAEILGLGFAVETATVLNDEPLLGKGMAAAVRGALTEAGLRMHTVDFRLSDVAGEAYAFHEMVLAQGRVMREVRERQPLWHPATVMGDCGAVAGLVQIAWAEQAFARNYSPGRNALCHSSAAFGARAAAVVGQHMHR